MNLLTENLLELHKRANRALDKAMPRKIEVTYVPGETKGKSRPNLREFPHEPIPIVFPWEQSAEAPF